MCSLYMLYCHRLWTSKLCITINPIKRSLVFSFCLNKHKNKSILFTSSTINASSLTRVYNFTSTISFFLPTIHYVVVILSQYFLWQFCFLLYNPFKYMPNLSHTNLKVLYFTWVCLLNSFSIHDPNNKWSTNPYICCWLHMLLFVCPILS